MTDWFNSWIEIITYVQLTIMEAILLFLLYRVHKWSAIFGPFIDALAKRFGGKSGKP